MNKEAAKYGHLKRTKHQWRSAKKKKKRDSEKKETMERKRLSFSPLLLRENFRTTYRIDFFYLYLSVLTDYYTKSKNLDVYVLWNEEL